MGLSLIHISFEQLLCQLATSRNNIIMRTWPGDTSTFACHYFNKLSRSLSCFGAGTQQSDILFIDVRHLYCIDFIRFLFQISFDSSHHTTCLCKSMCFANRRM